MIPIRQVAPRADVGYTKLSQIGEGGFGKVYNARRNADGTVFALKEMKPRDNVTQSEMRADLRKELDCIQRVQPHHHIIQAYDAFEKGPEFSLIVFPAANGGHLQRYLQNIPRAGATSPGTIDVVEKAFGCLAHGLAHMHVRHLRHKDIKPGNILLHGGRVIWTDFGLAKDFTNVPNSISNGPPVGTYPYWAPELQSGTRRDSKTDVYALGCVFIEMVAALEGIQLRFRHDFRSSMPTLWAQLDHHFSRRTPRTFLVKIIKGMTQTDPSKRWTASQVFSALEPYGYCCETCSPHGGGGEVEVDDDDDDEDDEDEEDEDSAPSPWIYDPRYGKHYRVAHDAQGNVEYIWHTH